MTVKGIEVAGIIYDNEDETARSTATEAASTARTASQTATQASETATTADQTATQASETAGEANTKIGTLANLETTEKTNLVAAINEVNGNVAGINKQIKNIAVSSQTIQKNSKGAGLTKLASVQVPKNSVVTISISYWNAWFTITHFVISEENKTAPYPTFVKLLSSDHPQDGLTVTLCNTDNEDRSFGVYFECQNQVDTPNPFYLMTSTMLLND